MRPVTDSFLKALSGSHQMVSRARIIAGGLVGVNPGTINPDGSPLGEIPINEGDVQSNLTADINATLNLTTAFDWPESATDDGTPYGQEVFVERGIQFGDGNTEWVGLGYFRINSISQRAPDGLISITGEDRSSNLRDGRALAPVQFGAGASVQAVVEFLVHEVMPTVPVLFDFSAGTTLLAASHILEEDRLKFLQDLVASYGKIMFFDYAGRLQVRSAPDPTKAAIYTVKHGANGTLVNMNRTLSRDGVYNAVVATGEAAGELPPVRGVALDTVPGSPTLFGGPFGQVARFFSSTFMTTETQCVDAARAMLLQATGLPYTVTLDAVPNPALETGDVISVTYDDHRDTETHIVDSITYPLKTDTEMTIETRKQYL